MNLIAFMIAAFITVFIAYVLVAETLNKQTKSPTSNAITDKGGNPIKIHLNNSTNNETNYQSDRRGAI